VYIQSAAGDAGGAIGAAFVVWNEGRLEVVSRKSEVERGKIKDPGSKIQGPSLKIKNEKIERSMFDDPPADRFVMDHAYWGPSYSNEEVAAVLEKNSEAIAAEGCVVEQIADEDALCMKAAKSISEGKVIGWFQGRMEWGPRALGNRSIVCDPRRADMKDILNLKIKRRESFRPFAPSILRESVSEWFEEDDDVPFMMKVFQIREEQRAEIPAVTHADGSGRLQTVYKETNPRYYNLIEKFRDITGVPIVLNTSFNENEPVVCKPEEALACFLRTKMDVLVMGNWFVQRSN
jgi:carbamoyltransferase